MKIQTIFTAVALLATALIVKGTVAEGSRARAQIKRDVSELTQIERVLLRLTHPEVYSAYFPRNADKINHPGMLYPSYSLFDFLNVDLPTLALQFSKSGNVLLPNLQYESGFYFCYIGVCTGYLEEFNYGATEVRNANLTTLNTKINSTHLDIEFKIPDLQIISETFTLVHTDLVTNDTRFWRGLSIFVSNYTIRVQANLEMVTDVGLQLSNTLMSFGVDDFRLRKENATHTFPNGTVEEWGYGEKQNAPDMNADWEKFETDITTLIESWLNCFLSNGRLGQECDEFINKKLQRDNFVQVLQTIGLGIVHNLDQSETKSVIAENEEKTSLLLPQFPFPSIKSILLDLPILIVQIGKVLEDVLDPSYTLFQGYPLAYDFIRENCSSGVCRNIRENMALPEYGVGGFSENQFQVDIQPNNFSYSLKVPNLVFDGEQLQHETTYLDSGFREVYLGAHFTIVNGSFGISGDYELKEGVGLQVSNLGLTLRLGELQLRVPQYYTVDNGETSEVQELRIDIAPQIMEIWNEVDENGVSFERRYEEYIQGVINSQLVG